MPVDSFRFVSPGVFINEIDQSQVSTDTLIGAGPVVFGVSEKGPALVPTQVGSFGEFVEIFGNPIPGAAAQGDVWRTGNYSNPTYGAYAAQAFLANGGPLTFVRLVGDQESGGTGKAGWDIPALAQTTGVQTSDGASYGLFIIGSGSGHVAAGPDQTGEGMLAAIFHLTGSGTTIELSGPKGSGNAALNVTASACMVAPVSVGSNREFRVRISGSNEILETTFNFNPKSGRYIRNVFNTNPHLLNTSITAEANRKDYFLAESYERAVVDSVQGLAGTDITRDQFSGSLGIVLGLVNGSVYGGDFSQAYITPGTPWIVGQDLNTDASLFDVNNSVQPLFRVMSREGTEFAQSHYKISISDVKQSTNPLYQPYGTFTLLVRHIDDTDENPRILEQYNNLDLNPASFNFIGKRIGDRSFNYDSVNKKWTEIGQYPVQSRLIRVELNAMVEDGSQDASLLPFGFRGIPAFTGFQVQSGSTAILAYPATGSFPANTSGSTDLSIVGPLAGSGSVPAAALAPLLSPDELGHAVQGLRGAGTEDAHWTERLPR